MKIIRVFTKGSAHLSFPELILDKAAKNQLLDSYLGDGRDGPLICYIQNHFKVSK